jgi:hypothetical protein
MRSSDKEEDNGEEGRMGGSDGREGGRGVERDASAMSPKDIELGVSGDGEEKKTHGILFRGGGCILGSHTLHTRLLVYLFD